MEHTAGTAPKAKRKKIVNDASDMDVRWQTGWLEQPFSVLEALGAIDSTQSMVKHYDQSKLQKFVSTCEVGDGRFELRVVKTTGPGTSFVFIRGVQTGTDICVPDCFSLGGTSRTPVITQNDVTIALAFGRIAVKHFGPRPQGPLLFCGKSVDEELTVVEVFVPTEASSKVAEEPQVLCHFYDTGFDENPYYVGSRFLSAEECRRNNLAVQTDWFYQLDDEGPTVPAGNFVEMQSFFNVRPQARLDEGKRIDGLAHVWFDNKRFNFGDGADTDDTGTE